MFDAFHVHDVERIHRLSWEQIDKPDDLATGTEAYATGIISFNEKMAILLDFEKILVEINPDTGITVEQVKELGKRNRSEKQRSEEHTSELQSRGHLVC